MQTPESSPDRRKSPLSSLTQKSWRNLRSKMQVLSPSPREESRGQFVVLSSSLNSQREPRLPGSPPLILVAPSDDTLGNSGRSVDGAETPPPLPAAPPQSKLSESLISKDAPLNRSSAPLTLGEPFGEDTAISDSDRGSTFSFNRQMSRKYYKDPEDIEATGGSARSPCGSFGSYASYDSYGSYGSYVSNGSYVSSSDLFYAGVMDSEDLWTEDLSHLEEPDYLSALISEANEIPFDDELGLDDLHDVSCVRRVKSAPISWGNSMHRQLSFDSNKSASSTLDDLKPKRARSTMSTASSVWPILE